MYELVQVGERTYYIQCPAKIGVYRVSDSEVWLIDSGSDKDAGRRVMKLMREQSWNVVGIVNTHSNADHIGGNEFIRKRTECVVLAPGLERAFTEFPILEPSFLYGGYPCKELRNKFLMAQSCGAVDEVAGNLPEGLRCFSLPGHFFDMIGIRTSDDVVFLADCVFGANIVEKYHLSFIYNVKAFLETLDLVDEMRAALFVPAHAEAVTEIRPLTEVNRNKVMEVAEQIVHFCASPVSFEEVLKAVFDQYGLVMDFNQYVLIGSTVRSYLSYLHDEGRLAHVFHENRLLWKAVS